MKENFKAWEEYMSTVDWSKEEELSTEEIVKMCKETRRRLAKETQKE